MLGLCFCARAFSSCGKWGPLFIAVRGPLIIAASLVAEHRLQTRRLSNCGSRAQLLCGMWDLPRPGLEPVSLHWQADSQSRRHQGSPASHFKRSFHPPNKPEKGGYRYSHLTMKERSVELRGETARTKPYHVHPQIPIKSATVKITLHLPCTRCHFHYFTCKISLSAHSFTM